jgi:hypothetical protein
MTDPNETADLSAELIRGYRERKLANAGLDRDLGMVIRALSADGLRDVLLTLTDRRPDLVGQALADCMGTWDPDSPDALAVVQEG